MTAYHVRLLKRAVILINGVPFLKMGTSLKVVPYDIEKHQFHARIQRGTGGPDPLEKSQK